MKKSFQNEMAAFPHIGCIIMASGEGRRFGSNKLLADFAGKPMIQHILDSTENIFSRRIVVTRSEDVYRHCISQGAETLLHNLPRRNDTIRIGLEYIMADIDGCMFCPGDQPLVSIDSLKTMARAYLAQPEYIYRLSFGENTGMPVLFPRWTFPLLLQLPEGCGGSSLIKKHPALVENIAARDEFELEDIDTPDDLKRILALIKP